MDNISAAMVTFDVTKQAMGTAELASLFSAVPQVIDWWNYIPGVFIVKHWGNNVDVSTNLVEGGLKSFLLVPVDPTQIQGILPPSSWEKLFNEMFKDEKARILSEHRRRKDYRDRNLSQPVKK